MQQKELKSYDAWLHWAVTDRCNLNCAYCLTANKKTARLPEINIPLLIATLEKTNKVFRISFTGGGEPFLVPNLVETCTELTKKHYISFNTNLTSSRVKEFALKINPERVTCIGASMHIKELERTHLLERYVNHFLLLQEKGFRVSAIEVAYPSLCEEAEQYKKNFQRMGIELKFSPFLGEYGGRKYPPSYTDKELKTFRLRGHRESPAEYGSDLTAVDRYYQYRQICNAGYNVGVVDTAGNIYPCNLIKNRIGNVYINVKFRDNLVYCPFRFCGCPLNRYDSYLFKRALTENKATPEKLNFFFVLHNFLKRQWQKMNIEQSG